jgi:Fe-S-cluster containining protein
VASEPEERPGELRFECTGCGQCCSNRGEYSHVYVNAEEVNALARFLGLLPMEFRSRYTFEDEYGWTQLFLEESCTFLEPGTRRCRVYPARPIQCRTFPFWGELIEGGRWTAEARSLCEGVGRGQLHSIEEIERNIEEMAASSDPED